MKSLVVAAMLVLVASPAALAQDDWVEGTVTEITKLQEAEPVGTTPSGITIGRLTYGVAVGMQQQAFVDLRYSSGDVQYGISGNYDFIPMPSSLRLTQLAVYYALPNVAIRFATDSWAVAVTRPVVTGIALQFIVGATAQAVQVLAQSERWTLTGSVEWRSGVPTTAVVLQYSSPFVVGN